MKTRIGATALLTIGLVQTGLPQDSGLKQEVEQAMMKATRYMVEEVSNRGGYVWYYLPDLSRAWGEMEAYPSMIWVQPPGTPSMGQIFLDAYHATGEEYYYRAAKQAALALIRGQLACGGWNYIIDFAGEASLKHWYATIGKNGWRLEEFSHYYGNATFDDDATYAPARFLLRIYLEKYDPVFLEPLKKAIGFIIESQYPDGGWPQRYPLRYDYPSSDRTDYTSYITLNDGVHMNNVRFLIECYGAIGDHTLLESIRRAMNCIIVLQHGAPQPGWSWQYTLDLQPAGARTYEPDGLYSGATLHCINLLMDYYELTGETKFLTRVPGAIRYLESLALPKEVAALYPRELHPGQKVYPSCIELGTNRPVYVHRRGSNAINGKYYSDHDPVNQWMPTFSMRALDTDQLKKRYERLEALSPEEVKKNSPLFKGDDSPLPEYIYSRQRETGSPEVIRILGELKERPYWEGVFAGSNPYVGDGPEKVPDGNFSTTQVGDRFDTSPYRFGEDVRGISTQEYIENMSRLISFLRSVSDPGSHP